MATIHAYPETFVSRIQKRIGNAFDFAINVCGINGDDFVKQFLGSSICSKIEFGSYFSVLGKSGIEIAMDIIYETTGKEIDNTVDISILKSEEYWIGWILAYYQWYSNKTFIKIFECISYQEFEQLYYTLHEADITKAVDVIDKIISERSSETNLKQIRKESGITQKELSLNSGVSLRSIQMYEQRNKDINKASSETLYLLSKTLGCRMEDLMEF